MPQSREHEKRPAAGRKQNVDVQKKTHFHFVILYIPVLGVHIYFVDMHAYYSVAQLCFVCMLFLGVIAYFNHGRRSFLSKQKQSVA